MYKLRTSGLLVCWAILSVVGAYPLVEDKVVAFRERRGVSEYARTRSVREALPYPHFHHRHQHRPHHGGFDEGQGGFVGGPGGFGGGQGGFGRGPGSFGGGPGGFGGGPGSFGGGQGGFGGGPGGFGGGFGSSGSNAASFSTSLDTPFGDVSYSASNANSFSGAGGFNG